MLLLDDVARRHHGLITRAMARDLGVSSSTFTRAVASGMLELLYPSVARLAGTPDTFHQRVLAAILATGDGGIASHRTAAALWGVERPADDPIDVILPSRRRHSLPAHIVIHRPRDLADLRPISRYRIPTTNPLRMLLDLGAVDEGAVYDALISVLSSKVVSPPAVRNALMRHSQKGRHGITALRTAFERWADDELPPDSKLEALVAVFVVEHRLPPVRFHAAVEGFEVDFQFIGTPVLLEADGWATHGLDRDQFEFDRVRDAILTAAGYSVIHFTWAHLRDRPSELATRIRKVLERRAPEVLAGTTVS